jgi:hypothetical protein
MKIRNKFRDNISNVKKAIFELYNDKTLRIILGGAAYNVVSDMRSRVNDNIKTIENLYMDLVNQKFLSSSGEHQ